MKNNIGEVVEIIPPVVITKESIADYLAECASVVRDKSPASAEKLLKRLMTESFGSTASRVLEYIPCVLSQESDALSSKFADAQDSMEFTQFFGTFYNSGEAYYTNARELLNLGFTFEEVLEVADFTNYRAFKCVAPYFIYGQLSTHNQVTSVSHSQRYGTCDRGYWIPPEYQAFYNSSDYSICEAAWSGRVENSTPLELKEFMKKDLGIKRKEVWDRGADMLQNRVFTLGGYTNNPNAWRHFIDQRLDIHTQLETRTFCELIKAQM